jgi:hypothetical protein
MGIRITHQEEVPILACEISCMVEYDGQLVDQATEVSLVSMGISPVIGMVHELGHVIPAPSGVSPWPILDAPAREFTHSGLRTSRVESTGVLREITAIVS